MTAANPAPTPEPLQYRARHALPTSKPFPVTKR